MDFLSKLRVNLALIRLPRSQSTTYFESKSEDDISISSIEFQKLFPFSLYIFVIALV